MNAPLRLAYAVTAQLARAASAVAPPGDAKLLRALRARRGIRTRYRAWAGHGRHTAHPLLWMHAPSVGEGLQARPVLELTRRERPDVELAYTFFSPSAERFAAGLDVDFRDYLPFDTASEARAAIAALKPTALVFSKLDVWPVLVREAANAGVRVGMISATLATGSSRRGGIAGALLRGAYARLEAVGAIDDGDAERLIELGVQPRAIEITGDTRYDQVWARAAAVNRSAPPLSILASPRPTVVAGSTWPPDEAALFPAFLAARKRVPNARLIIAPHEPTTSHLAPIERWAAESSLTLARLDAPAAPTADVVLVDRVGVLGDLYALADVAFVGGGFHDAGLHSVLEPAAFGAPVLFGPQHAGSRDAGLLIDRGGGVAAESAIAVEMALTRWLESDAARRQAGERARALVRAGLGAARRSFALVSRLLD